MQIETLSDLQSIVRDLSGSYCLAADIDASATKNWDSGKGFTPLGDEANRFSGVLDGNGHTIRNLFINRPGQTHVGLIGYLATDQGKVCNLSLTNVKISGNKYVGGLAGINNGGTITRCQVSGKVSGKSTVGGVAGCCMGIIEQCRAAVNVSGNDRVGGLVGANTEGAIDECHAYGKVSGKVYDIGGLAGCGYNAHFDKCYWDIRTTGQQDSSGGEGKTTKEMKSRSTFGGWDFEIVWQIEEGNSYPSLRCIPDGPGLTDGADRGIEFGGLPGVDARAAGEGSAPGPGARHRTRRAPGWREGAWAAPAGTRSGCRNGGRSLDPWRR